MKELNKIRWAADIPYNSILKDFEYSLIHETHKTLSMEAFIPMMNGIFLIYQNPTIFITNL